MNVHRESLHTHGRARDVFCHIWVRDADFSVLNRGQPSIADDPVRILAPPASRLFAIGPVRTIENCEMTTR
jgi:hypothetical protein